MENNTVSIDVVISRIEENGYIDCTKLGGYMEDYEYDNIIYYLKKCKDSHNIIEENISLRKQNDVLWKQKLAYIGRINDAIEILTLCDSQCAKETIEILKG